MNGAELVRLVTNALFLVVFVGALRTALRERSRTSIDASILFGALAVVIYLPAAAEVFRFAPLSAAELLGSTSCGFAAVVWYDLRKLIRRRERNRTIPRAGN